MTASVLRLPHRAQRNFRSFSGRSPCRRRRWLAGPRPLPLCQSSCRADRIALQGAVDALRQRAERAENEVGEAHMRADVAVALADRTLVQLAEASTEIEKLRDRLDASEGRPGVAEEAATELRQADAARRGQGLPGEATRGVAGRVRTGQL